MDDEQDVLTYYFGTEDHRLASKTEALARNGNIWDALLYGTLYLPETRVVDGVVFLRSWHTEDDAEFDQERRRMLADVVHLDSIARMARLSDYNWVEIDLAIGRYIHPYKGSAEFLEKCYDLLAERVASSWNAWLHKEYPQRRFIARVISEKETGGSVGVGFEEISD